MFQCDLHTHTLRSDGHLTPWESIDRAAAFGLRVLAVTDHDTVLPLYHEICGQRINLEDYAAGKGIELVRGIEISCDSHNDDVHIIGLFCQWDNSEFARLETQVQESRIAAYKKVMENLQAAGCRVDWQELLRDAGKEKCPERVIKKHIYEYLAAKGYVSDWKDGKKLIMSNPALNTEREKPSPGDMIGLIHKTGGIAILAHPFLIKDEPLYKGNPVSRYAYIDMLVQAGLDGIEAAYTYDKTSYAGPMKKEEIEQEIRRRYRDSGLFFSGGSDFHGDFRRGVENPRELGECGVSYEYYCRHIRRQR